KERQGGVEGDEDEKKKEERPADALADDGLLWKGGRPKKPPRHQNGGHHHEQHPRRDDDDEVDVLDRLDELKPTRAEEKETQRRWRERLGDGKRRNLSRARRRGGIRCVRSRASSSLGDVGKSESMIGDHEYRDRDCHPQGAV